MAATAIMTMRIEPALLAALKRRARKNGRSVSAEVLQLIRRDVAPDAEPRPRARVRSAGMFPGFEAPDLDEFKRLRRRLSASLAPSPKRSRRRS